MIAPFLRDLEQVFGWLLDASWQASVLALIVLLLEPMDFFSASFRMSYGVMAAIVTLGIGYAIWGLIVWGRGQTPALQVLGMRCWRPETGRVAGWGWMVLREIVGRFAEGLLGPITLVLSLVLMVSGREHKSLHDHIAGTVVLRDPTNVLAARP